VFFFLQIQNKEEEIQDIQDTIDNINTKTTLSCYVGDELDIDLKFKPSTATNKSITYIASNDSLEIKGSTIIAKKKGNVILTIKNKVKKLCLFMASYFVK